MIHARYKHNCEYLAILGLAGVPKLGQLGWETGPNKLFCTLYTQIWDFQKVARIKWKRSQPTDVYLHCYSDDTCHVSLAVRSHCERDMACIIFLPPLYPSLRLSKSSLHHLPSFGVFLFLSHLLFR